MIALHWTTGGFRTLLFAVLLHGINTATADGCNFPEYAQSPLDEYGEPMAWHTRVWWLNLRHEPKLREMQEIYVQKSQIWSLRQNNKLSCDRKSKRMNHRAISSFFGSCSEKFLLYNRTCLTEERFNRFRVIQYGPGRQPTFVCLKLVKRSETIIQVMEGPTMESNDPNLCDERKLVFDEWPWIAPWRKEVVTCPISGGFMFRTMNKLTTQDFCEDEWRKSRLEVDCAKGDGLHFIAPRGSRCNPFSSTSEESKFYCWAGWQEKTYTFLVVGDKSGLPQYCLRFPRDISHEFTVMVYFSVLCPLQADGMPPTGIEYHEMQVETLVDRCVDDDHDRCDEVARKGQCKKEEKYAAHCQRACNKCGEQNNLLDITCPFSSSVQGDWLYIDKHHKEDVHINQSTVIFGRLGSFLCKERSVFSDKLFKTVTLFDNGCAMRYTCFEFQRRTNNVLQVRIGSFRLTGLGPSSRLDASFTDLCVFEDNISPVVDGYQSKNMKNLILSGRLRDEHCGFSHLIPFNGSVYGEPCAGSVSDWDSDACVTRGVITVTSDSCSNLEKPLEYQCLAFLSDHPLEKFLITRSLVSGEYNCWILTSFLCDTWRWQYRALYKLDTPQCLALSDSACVLDRPPDLLLYLHDEDKTRHCKGFVRTHIAPSESTMTSLTKSNPTQVDNDIVDANMPYLGSDTGSKSHGIYQMDSVGRIENMASSNGINIMKNYVIQAQIAILLFLVHVTIITQIIIFPT